MARKATKKKRAASPENERAGGSDAADGKTSRNVMSKFEEFDVKEILQKEQQASNNTVTTPSADGTGTASGTELAGAGSIRSGDVAPAEVAAEVSGLPAAPHSVSEQIPPGEASVNPADEELVPLPTLQVVPMISRAAEANCGLLKEPAPPATIRRVTQPDVPAPAMPTALMELLCA
uniref:Uncharacterized protein n=1 Tax=Trypanosoma congolense (strain IL3000) TaxID=1068625 RepID=G0UWH8_TRYCI|nr:conserved hypothetical protein [Trypanosoma congolense IL3000]